MLKEIIKKRKSKFSLNTQSKPETYYDGTRNEMLEFLPATPRKMLEYGCGTGEFSELVKNLHGTETWAVEVNPLAAQGASQKLYRVICDDAQTAFEQLPNSYFDCIVMFDFLEHLVDPFCFLVKVREKLSPDGIIVASIPNVRYHKTFFNYLLRGDWQYERSGILDNTHLRFFTQKSILKMFVHLGYEVICIQGIHRSRKKKLKIINLFTFNRFKDIAYLQFAVQACLDKSWKSDAYMKCI